jgi:hypothetical protein
MLRADVKQLLNSQGVAFVEHGHVLLNLNVLFAALLDTPLPPAE